MLVGVHIFFEQAHSPAADALNLSTDHLPENPRFKINHLEINNPAGFAVMVHDHVTARDPRLVPVLKNGQVASLHKNRLPVRDGIPVPGVNVGNMVKKRKSKILAYLSVWKKPFPARNRFAKCEHEDAKVAIYSQWLAARMVTKHVDIRKHYIYFLQYNGSKSHATS
jgi:hypothetical protein